MVFKFKNVEDKYKFLTTQMRIFGYNIKKYSNIKF